ncbi:cellulose binding domain-containing protein [Actinoplanes sp. NPDC051343]|uniref:cellulose binding domain-containing protein n=1 Tax=Actinoplanes sp. NPDC051343 TaxID=3363906 RepID=UPI00379CA1F5
MKRGAFTIAIACLAGMLGAPAAHADDPAPVTVTVNARSGLSTVAGTALGVNDAVWDAQLGTTAVTDLLGAAGVKMIRYPGGSYADIYHWKDNTAPGGYVAPDTDFDTFMGSVKRIGAQPMIIANYGTGSAAEAADWVRYANVTKGYSARYWAIGNENYGNGHYGSAWEADDHADLSPTAYADEVIAYSDAMKAVDPTIKIGAVLTMPANWPDGIVAAGDIGTWNQTVLKLAGPKIDFVDVHWYPGGSSAADSLTKTQYLDDALYLLRRQIGDDRIQISLTEVNAGVGEDTQPGALFLADAYSSLIENGVFTVDWWNVHNGMGTVSTVEGQTDYGDYGMLSSGNCNADNTVCEPPMNTPLAPYHALKVMSSFAHPGDQMIRAGASDPLVKVHASLRANGDLGVLLLNEDPSAAKTVALHYEGYSPSTATPAVTSYLNGGTSVQTAPAGTAASQTLPAYSVTLLTLHPAAAPTGLPAAPGRPAASAVTDRTATISWPAAAPGRHPIAKYEVFRQNGAISEELGETSATTLSVGNLSPGTRYTVTVLARDTAGAVSRSSLPLTFATGAPAVSTCSVHFADTNDWGNGYVGQIDVTNTGAAALSGWTLAFTWPTGWQGVDSGWNGTWSQSGRTVRVTDSPALAATGGTVSVGFVGNYSGPNIAPGTFTVNGTVCSVT